MKAREKWDILQKKAAKYPSTIRYGQSLMCALQEIDPPLYMKITCSVADCFYDDKKCTAFAAEVMSTWCEAEKA